MLLVLKRMCMLYFKDLLYLFVVLFAIGVLTPKLFGREKRNEIITIVNKGEYQKLMKYINQEDPEAFITVYTVSDMRYLPKK